jgi:hypothetical protein
LKELERENSRLKKLAADQALEAKLRKKDEVLVELMEEHVALKRVLERSEGPMGSA